MFAACSNESSDENKRIEKTLLYIAVTSTPTKSTYSVGEQFDSTGLEVFAYYSDNAEKDVTASCTLTGFDSATSGEKIITVSYTDGSVTEQTTFSVYVQENEQNNPDDNPIDNPIDNPDEPSDDTESIAAGDIILSDGTIVKKDSYTAIDSTNPPVAIVVSYNDYTEVATGIGLYRSDENLALAINGTYGYELNKTECTLSNGSSNKYMTGVSAETATWSSGYRDGSYFWRIIYNTIYNNETAQKKFRQEVINVQKNFPAFNWANTYGQTYKDYLGSATTGWYIPSLSELYTVFRNIETVNESISAVYKAMGEENYPEDYIEGKQYKIPTTRKYWTSSTKPGSGLNSWFVDFYDGFAAETVPTGSALDVLVVRSVE